MRRKINYTEKKYRLLEILHSDYSKIKAAQLRNQIINQLDISERTLVSWLYMSKSQNTEIRYTHLKKIANILNVQVDDLINYTIA